MSLKGFSKSFARAPQQLKAKFNMGENTKDPVYMDAERRFQDLEKEVKKLHSESKRYFEAIDGMLVHQIEFSQAIAELYQPISGQVSDPDATQPEGNPEGIEACEAYSAIVRELLEKLSPELQQIETHIINPADELLEIIKAIRKIAVKREHKKLDYDRHRNALKKLQDKKEKSLKDEKQVYKAENQLEVSTQEYDQYNDLLKEELPRLFELEADFIQPLFRSFYYMQLNVFYTLHDHMQGMDIPYFELGTDIEEGFERKRGDIKSLTEQLSIVHFKTQGGRKPSSHLQKTASLRKTSASSSATTMSGSAEGQAPPSYQAATAGAAAGAIGADYATAPSYNKAQQSSSFMPYPAQQQDNTKSLTSSMFKAPPTQTTDSLESQVSRPSTQPSAAAAATEGGGAAETVTALYDYQSQTQGDLSFAAGDVIEIVRRTNNTNEWWVGKCHGEAGQFPANYVQFN